MPRPKKTKYKIDYGMRKGYFQKVYHHFSSREVPVIGCHDDNIKNAIESSRPVSASYQWMRPPQDAYRYAISSMTSSCDQ